MKTAMVCILLALMAHASFAAKKTVATDTYYIYVKPGDKLFAKFPYKNTISISYLCKCYVATRNLSFICPDFQAAEVKAALPAGTISMTAFAAIAKAKEKAKKLADLDKASIYIVEQYSAAPLRYRYLKVTFYAQ